MHGICTLAANRTVLSLRISLLLFALFRCHATSDLTCPENAALIPGTTTCIDKAGQLVTPCNKDLCDIKRSRCKQNGGDFCTKEAATTAFANGRLLGLSFPTGSQYMPTSTQYRMNRWWMNGPLSYGWGPSCCVNGTGSFYTRCCYPAGTLRVVVRAPVTSGVDSRTVKIPKRVQCPESVNKDNWLNPRQDADMFAIKSSGSQEVTVQRLKGSATWGNDLQILCVQQGFCTQAGQCTSRKCVHPSKGVVEDCPANTCTCAPPVRGFCTRPADCSSGKCIDPINGAAPRQSCLPGLCECAAPFQCLNTTWPSYSDGKLALPPGLSQSWSDYCESEDLHFFAMDFGCTVSSASINNATALSDCEKKSGGSCALVDARQALCPRDDPNECVVRMFADAHYKRWIDSYRTASSKSYQLPEDVMRTISSVTLSGGCRSIKLLKSDAGSIVLTKSESQLPHHLKGQIQVIAITPERGWTIPTEVTCAAKTTGAGQGTNNCDGTMTSNGLVMPKDDAKSSDGSNVTTFATLTYSFEQPVLLDSLRFQCNSGQGAIPFRILTSPTGPPFHSFRAVPTFGESNAAQITTAAPTTAIVTTTTTTATTTIAKTTTGASSLSGIAAGRGYSMVLKEDGSLWAAGNNKDGQLGAGSRPDAKSFLQVIPSGVKSVAAHTGHTLVNKIDGSVWATGNNANGQLGDGSKETKKIFVKVIASGVTAVAVGESHSIVLKQDGSVWTTGANGYGVGTGKRRSQTISFVLVMTRGAKAVAAGQSHSMVLQEDGSVWATGRNKNGQLGDESYSNRVSFVKVISDSVVAVAAGGQHSMVLKQDGAVWAAGRNQQGEFGDGSWKASSSFVKVMPSGARAVSAGYQFSMVLKNDGSVWATGYNQYGQLGDGSNSRKQVFTKVIASGVQAVAAGWDHSMVLKNDSTVWATGRNTGGQFGDKSPASLIRTKFVEIIRIDTLTTTATTTNMTTTTLARPSTVRDAGPQLGSSSCNDLKGANTFLLQTPRVIKSVQMQFLSSSRYPPKLQLKNLYFHDKSPLPGCGGKPLRAAPNGCASCLGMAYIKAKQQCRACDDSGKRITSATVATVGGTWCSIGKSNFFLSTCGSRASANAYCQNRGAHLAVISDAHTHAKANTWYKQQTLSNDANQCRRTDPWIGGSCFLNSCKWTASSIGFTPWRYHGSTGSTKPLLRNYFVSEYQPTGGMFNGTANSWVNFSVGTQFPGDRAFPDTSRRYDEHISSMFISVDLQGNGVCGPGRVRLVQFRPGRPKGKKETWTLWTTSNASNCHRSFTSGWIDPTTWTKALRIGDRLGFQWECDCENNNYQLTIQRVSGFFVMTPPPIPDTYIQLSGDCNGKGLGDRKGLMATDCAHKCDINDECAGFSYYPEGDCQLRSTACNLPRGVVQQCSNGCFYAKKRYFDRPDISGENRKLTVPFGSTYDLGTAAACNPTKTKGWTDFAVGTQFPKGGIEYPGLLSMHVEVDIEATGGCKDVWVRVTRYFKKKQEKKFWISGGGSGRWSGTLDWNNFRDGARIGFQWRCDCDKSQRIWVKRVSGFSSARAVSTVTAPQSAAGGLSAYVKLNGDCPTTDPMPQAITGLSTTQCARLCDGREDCAGFSFSPLGKCRTRKTACTLPVATDQQCTDERFCFYVNKRFLTLGTNNVVNKRFPTNNEFTLAGTQNTAVGICERKELAWLEGGCPDDKLKGRWAASTTALGEVQCCAVGPKGTGVPDREEACVEGETILGKVDFAEAMTLCHKVGKRLCTRTEILNQTRPCNAKCRYDNAGVNALVWTSNTLAGCGSLPSAGTFFARPCEPESCPTLACTESGYYRTGNCYTGYKCKPCPAGTYLRKTGTMSECIPCGPSFYQNLEGQTTCKPIRPCVPNATVTTARTPITDQTCECNVDFYGDKAVSPTRCTACPPCALGSFRRGCGGNSDGSCVPCSNAKLGETYTRSSLNCEVKKCEPLAFNHYYSAVDKGTGDCKSAPCSDIDDVHDFPDHVTTGRFKNCVVPPNCTWEIGSWYPHFNSRKPSNDERCIAKKCTGAPAGSKYTTFALGSDSCEHTRCPLEGYSYLSGEAGSGSCSKTKCRGAATAEFCGTCGGTANGAPCVFPFFYKGKEYNSCTTVENDAEKGHNNPWCATERNFNGQWGHCNCETCGGNANGAACVFPFFYKGKEYNSCTTVDHDENMPWCATTRDYNNSKWGNCNCAKAINITARKTTATPKAITTTVKKTTATPKAITTTAKKTTAKRKAITTTVKKTTATPKAITTTAKKTTAKRKVTAAAPAFSPQPQDELRKAVAAYLGKKWTGVRIEDWDVSKVADMSNIFSQAKSFDGDISKWDVSSVTDMSDIFSQAASFEGDISKWDVSSVTDMGGMFSQAESFDEDISKWTVSRVTNMAHMFSTATNFNQDISKWDVSNVTNMNEMFHFAHSFNADISKWDVSSVTDMGGMFVQAEAFETDISKWVVSRVTNMESMFAEAESFNADISNWDVTLVKDMSLMFSSVIHFNADISKWNVARVTTMSGMFSKAESFNRDIAEWDVSRVTDMANMFSEATEFNADISKWNVTRVTTMAGMFSKAESFDNDISKWSVSSVIYMNQTFKDAKEFNNDISKWDVSLVQDMSKMFDGARSFEQTLCGAWRTSKAKNENMFTDSLGKLCTAPIATTRTTTATSTTTAAPAQVTTPATSTADSTSADATKAAVATDLKKDDLGKDGPIFVGVGVSVAVLLVIIIAVAVFAVRKSRTLGGANRKTTRAASVVTFEMSTLHKLVEEDKTPLYLHLLTQREMAYLLQGIEADDRECLSRLGVCPDDFIYSEDKPNGLQGLWIDEPAVHNDDDDPLQDNEAAVETKQEVQDVEAGGVEGKQEAQSQIVFVNLYSYVSNHDKPRCKHWLTKRTKPRHQLQQTLPFGKISVRFPRKRLMNELGAVSQFDTGSHTYSLPLPEAIPSQTSTATVLIAANPTYADVEPMSDRTFSASNYKRHYDKTPVPQYCHSLLGSVFDIMKLYFERQCLTKYKEEADIFFKKIQEDAFQNVDSLQHNVDIAAELLWTSGKRSNLMGIELCSLLNAVIRDDVDAEMPACCVICRAINSRTSVRRKEISLEEQQFPPKGKTFRGGGFDNGVRGFFTEKKCFRTPGFLATSASIHVSQNFVFNVPDGRPRVLWTIELDPRGRKQIKYRVKNMTFVANTLIPGEGEYLFAPYSAFTVTKCQWSDDPQTPHEIKLVAAVDNRNESEHLPLAPWY